MFIRRTAPILFGFSMAFLANASRTSYINRPIASYKSEYDMLWNRYTNDNRQFYLVGTHNRQKVGGYETRNGQSVFGIPIGANRTDVEKKYGQPIAAIHRQNTSYILDYNNQADIPTHGTYLIHNYYVTFFYDLHKNNIVRSITWVAATTEMMKPGYYSKPSKELRKGLEDLMVELVNHDRVIAGLQPLIYEKKYNNIARQHSSNMISHHFFSHEDHQGNHSNDRMTAGGVDFYWYGENIAYGQYSSIFAHEALMNSKGHRNNILRKEFTHIFVGVSFKNNFTPYYTINFYSE